MKPWQKKLMGPMLKLNIALYRWSKGKIAGRVRGMPVLLLTCKGRKSGEARTVPIVYEPDGSDYIVIASMAGAPQNPVWFLNLVANPDCVVEVDDRKLDVRASVTSGDERARLWKKVVASGPFFESDYQAKTTREIPVVRLTPVAR